MRLQALSLLAVVFLAVTVQADDVGDAKTIVKKGMEAAGIKDVDKPILMTWQDKGKGTFTGGFTMDYAGTWAYQAPDKLRMDLKHDLNITNYKLVVNGKKAWETTFGQTMGVIGADLDVDIAQVYLFRISTLVPLLHGKDFKLASAGEKDVADKKALLVKVTQGKMPPVTLFFDKDSGLLVKSEMPIKDGYSEYKEVPQENFYEDYKDVGGRKFYTKMRMLRNGKALLESTISDQMMPDKIDPKLFDGKL
jgi:hypothetical protein